MNNVKVGDSVKRISAVLKPFGQLKIEQKLKLIEAFLRSKQMEFSTCGYPDTWKRMNLKKQTAMTEFDDHLFYRLYDDSAIKNNISDVEEQLANLTKQLKKLKESL